jgi:hypothetical protein
MAADFRFRLRLMRRRARLFSRQIAVATALTIAALGLLASTLADPGGPGQVAEQQASTGQQ